MCQNVLGKQFILKSLSNILLPTEAELVLLGMKLVAAGYNITAVVKYGIHMDKGKNVPIDYVSIYIINLIRKCLIQKKKAGLVTIFLSIA